MDQRTLTLILEAVEAHATHPVDAGQKHVQCAHPPDVSMFAPVDLRVGVHSTIVDMDVIRYGGPGMGQIVAGRCPDCGKVCLASAVRRVK